MVGVWYNYYSFWLVLLTMLKNDGVRQWEGWHPIYEMEHKKCLKPPTSILCFLCFHTPIFKGPDDVEIPYFWPHMDVPLDWDPGSLHGTGSAAGACSPFMMLDRVTRRTWSRLRGYLLRWWWSRWKDLWGFLSHGGSPKNHSKLNQF